MTDTQNVNVINSSLNLIWIFNSTKGKLDIFCMTSKWSAKTVQGALHKIGSVLKTEEGNVLKAFKVTQEITLSLNQADFAPRSWCAKVLCFQSLNWQNQRGSPLIENRKQEEAPTCCGSSPCGLDKLHVETYFQSSLCHLDALHVKILFVYSGHIACKHIWIWKHMKRKKLCCATFFVIAVISSCVVTNMQNVIR